MYKKLLSRFIQRLRKSDLLRNCKCPTYGHHRLWWLSPDIRQYACVYRITNISFSVNKS